MKELYLDGELFSGTEDEFLAVEKFYYKTWELNGKFHREDGPAVIYSNNVTFLTKEWRINGIDFEYYFSKFFPIANYIRYKYPGE